MPIDKRTRIIAASLSRIERKAYQEIKPLLGPCWRMTEHQIDDSIPVYDLGCDIELFSDSVQAGLLQIAKNHPSIIQRIMTLIHEPHPHKIRLVDVDRPDRFEAYLEANPQLADYLSLLECLDDWIDYQAILHDKKNNPPPVE